MASKKVNWVIVKAEYLGDRLMTLPRLAKKHGISVYYVQQISAKEGWVAQKKELLKKATEGALEEVEGSLKKLIVRHAKVARWLQNAGLSRLQNRVNMILKREKLMNSDKRNDILKATLIKSIDDRILLAMVAEGLKAERDLYPKQLQLEGGFDVGVEVKGISKALDKALYQAFRKGLGRKRPSIHNERKNKGGKRSKNSPKK